MKPRAHKTSYQKQRVSSALLFALAILVIVVSCPLKRMLTTPSSSSVSSPRIAYAGISQGIHIAVTSKVSCCALKGKVILLETALKTRKAPLPFAFVASISQSGFAIPYFLSGTPKTCFGTETLLSSNRPLFLQHRRLLI